MQSCNMQSISLRASQVSLWLRVSQSQSHPSFSVGG